MNNISRQFLFRSVVILFLSLSLISCSDQNPSDQQSEKSNSKLIVFQNIEFQVDVADTPETLSKGLSGTKSLDENKGLLFDFKVEGIYPFWMKDMNYSIDIIWLDKNLEVVHVEESVSPDTYPQSFRSTTPARYVLEINAGLTSKYEIAVGDTGQIIEK